MAPRPELVERGVKSSAQARIGNVVTELNLRDRERAEEDIISFLEAVKEIAQFKFDQEAEIIGLVIDSECVHPLVRLEEGFLYAAGGRNFQEFYVARTIGPVEPQEIDAVWVEWSIAKPVRYKKGYLASVGSQSEELVIYQVGPYDGEKSGVFLFEEGERKTVEALVKSRPRLGHPAIISGLRKAAGLIR